MSGYNKSSYNKSITPGNMQTPSMNMPMMGQPLFPMMPMQGKVSKVTHIVQKPLSKKKLYNKVTNTLVKENSKKKYKFKFQDKLYTMYNFDPRVDIRACPFYNYKRPERHDPDWFLGNKGTNTEENAAKVSDANAANTNGEYGLNSVCPFGKHISGKSFNKLVCAHWLKGLCKKNDQCEYLHEFNLRKMPECSHYQEHGTCTGLLIGNEDSQIKRFYEADEKMDSLVKEDMTEEEKQEIIDKITEEKMLLAKNQIKRRKECLSQHMDKDNGYLISPFLGTAGGESSLGIGAQKDLSPELDFILSNKASGDYVINDRILNNYPALEEDEKMVQLLLKDKRIIKCKVKLKNKKTGKIRRKFRYRQVCESYKLGFCYMGPQCKFKHIRCRLCPKYLLGFCGQGDACKEGEHIGLLNFPIVKEKLRIKPDSDLLGKKSDAKEQARLLALINDE